MGEAKGRTVAPDKVRFNADGLVPAIIQDVHTNRVLMLGYMNRDSLQKTLDTGLTWFYSRSRQRLWQKGETSGHVQKVKSVRVDCDQDTLLIQVEQVGPGACHEGFVSCFHYDIEGVHGSEGELDAPAFDPDQVYGKEVASMDTSQVSERVVAELYDVILDRKANPVEGSYTSYLFSAGIDKVLKKVGEESAEVIIAGKGGDRDGLVAEGADLIYHLLVLFVEAGVRPEDVWRELAKRRGGGGSEDAPPGK